MVPLLLFQLTVTQIAPPRLEATAVVDGILDDAAWSRAARLGNSTQYSPVDGRPAVQTTEVLVWYSPTALHFGIRAAAEPGTVAFAGYSLAIWQMSIWYSRAWSLTLKATMDGLIDALLTAGVFGWLWPR